MLSPEVPFVIIGTDTDVRKEKTSQYVSYEEGMELAKKLKAEKYFECSFSDYKSVYMILNSIADFISKEIFKKVKKTKKIFIIDTFKNIFGQKNGSKRFFLKKNEIKKERELIQVIDKTFNGYFINFQSVFKNQEMKKSFEEHLRKEFNTASYEFIKAVECILDEINPETTEQFVKVVEEFIEDKSKQEINISGKIKSEIISIYKRIMITERWENEKTPYEVLEDAKLTCYNDLKFEAFERFIYSEIGYNTISKLIENKDIITKKSNQLVQYKLDTPFYKKFSKKDKEELAKDLTDPIYFSSLFILNIKSDDIELVFDPSFIPYFVLKDIVFTWNENELIIPKKIDFHPIFMMKMKTLDQIEINSLVKLFTEWNSIMGFSNSPMTENKKSKIDFIQDVCKRIHYQINEYVCELVKHKSFTIEFSQDFIKTYSLQHKQVKFENENDLKSFSEFISKKNDNTFQVESQFLDLLANSFKYLK